MRVKDFFILTNVSNGSESMTFLGKQLEKPGNAMAKKGGRQISRISIIRKDSWENKSFWTKKRFFFVDFGGKATKSGGLHRGIALKQIGGFLPVLLN